MNLTPINKKRVLFCDTLFSERASMQGRRPPVHKFPRSLIKVDIVVDRIGEVRDCLRRSLEEVASKASDQTRSNLLRV